MEGGGGMGRRVGVAVDFSACSAKALKWAVDNIARDGDHLILVTVRPEAFYEGGEMQLWETTGSPLIPVSQFRDPATAKKYGVKPDPETLDIVTAAATQKKIVVVVKIYWGDAREKICEAIDKTVHYRGAPRPRYSARAPATVFSSTAVPPLQYLHVNSASFFLTANCIEFGYDFG